jgi:hypothetical protein
MLAVGSADIKPRTAARLRPTVDPNRENPRALFPITTRLAPVRAQRAAKKPTYQLNPIKNPTRKRA